MKYYLIHGYGKALDISENKIPANLGFYIFDEELKNKQAKAFDWALRVKRYFYSPFCPFSQIKLYNKERKEVENIALQMKLYSDLSKEKPEIVICHSMGCRLLLNTIRNFNIPESIKKVVFVSADLPDNQKISDSKIGWTNFYCWWDNALLTSIFLNFYLPIGLIGTKDKKFKNIFWKLKKGLSLHQGIWKDKDFKSRLSDLLEIT